MYFLQMLCLYRISDEAQTNADKPKLNVATKKNCLENFLSVFSRAADILILADCVSPSTLEWIHELLHTFELPHIHILQSQFRSGASNFLFAASIVKQLELPEDHPVYFVEDDYIHTIDACKVILEGLQIADYCTGYNHPDKFMPHMYPYGENSRVMLTKSTHWKTTKSTTMTFATKAGIVTRDFDVYYKYCHTGYPYDHEMFLELGTAGRTLASAIPGVSTHTEIMWLGPLLSWENELKKTLIHTSQEQENHVHD